MTVVRGVTQGVAATESLPLPGIILAALLVAAFAAVAGWWSWQQRSK